MVPPGCHAPLTTLVDVANVPRMDNPEDNMEETVPGEFGYASPRDLEIQTVLFEADAVLVQHTGRARDSMQALWSRLKAGVNHQPKLPWDLEEGGSRISDVAAEDLTPSLIPSPVLSIPTPITPYGPTPPSPLSDYVWSSPEPSSDPLTPYRPTQPSPLSDFRQKLRST